MQTFDNLTVLRNILNDEAVRLFGEYVKCGEEKFAPFAHAFYEQSKKGSLEINFAQYVKELIFFDDNIVSRTCASGKTISRMLYEAYLNDIKLVFGQIFSADTRGLYSNKWKGEFCAEDLISEWTEKYKRYGYGRFIDNYAFSFSGGKLEPIAAPEASSLSALKNYEAEKKLIDDNICNFIKGLPCSDMLLYGDRGTGKSSTLRATVQKYFDSRLRLIEISADSLIDIPAARKAVENNPLKFIIFIDDLSITEGDKNLSPLKACIEGTAALSKNTMIVATSNRRHIIKENFSDRDDAVHASDAIQEQLSLSDRFGITVMFSGTDKNEYLSIVRQLAKDLKINMPDGELCELAERWALNKGGRSPRRAKQICELIYSCTQRGVKVDF